MVASPEKGSLVDDMARALESGEGFDVTLEVGGVELRAHSFVLCARSPVLAAALRHADTVVLEDMDEETVRQLLCFLYTDQVPELQRLAPQLLAASNWYQLPLLQRMCEQQLVRSLTVENAAAAVVLALRHSCEQLKKRAIYYIRAHPLDVMATESWQRDLCADPEMVAEVSRLIAAPSAAQLFSEIGTAAGSTSSKSSSSSQSLNSQGWAAPSPGPRASIPPGSDGGAQAWGTSGDEMSAKLLEAAQKGSVEELQKLLAAGMDVGLKDEGQTTALHLAASNGHLDAVKFLLESGAEVNARDGNEDTPLHWAAGRGHAAVVRLLAEAAADPNAKGKYGMTPLHWAALCGHADAAAALLEAGAHMGAHDDCGSTPLDLIRRANHMDMVEMLS